MSRSTTKRILLAGTHWNDFALKTGFLINSDKAYVGASARILDYTSSPFGDASLNFFNQVRFILQAGYTFQRKPESKFSFTPQLVFGMQGNQPNSVIKDSEGWFPNNTYYDLNLIFRYKKLISGINTTGVMLGYQNSKFRLQVSNFVYDGFYTGSISLRYTFQKNGSARISGF